MRHLNPGSIFVLILFAWWLWEMAGKGGRRGGGSGGGTHR